MTVRVCKRLFCLELHVPHEKQVRHHRRTQEGRREGENAGHSELPDDRATCAVGAAKVPQGDLGVELTRFGGHLGQGGILQAPAGDALLSRVIHLLGATEPSSNAHEESLYELQATATGEQPLSRQTEVVPL